MINFKIKNKIQLEEATKTPKIKTNIVNDQVLKIQIAKISKKILAKKTNQNRKRVARMALMLLINRKFKLIKKMPKTPKNAQI